jgi:transcriptional/translational regulatory protein YebC/TACO1
MLLTADAGAEDFVTQEEGYEITTSPENFSAVREAVEAAGVPMVSAEITMLPTVMAELNDPEDVKKMRKLLDLLDDEDDVQDVYHNWEEDE